MLNFLVRISNALHAIQAKYTAALTGLLSKKIHDMDRYTPNNVSAIMDQCKAFADKALSDVEAHDEAGQ
jgi:hypothetical protein